MTGTNLLKYVRMKKKKNKQPELELQIQIAKYFKLQYPKHIFNYDMGGVRLNKSQAGQSKAAGHKKSWPDIQIAEPKGGYFGLFIEVKTEGTRLKKKNGDYASDHIKSQAEVIESLRARGYAAHFAVGFDRAKEIIDAYMSLPKTASSQCASL